MPPEARLAPPQVRPARLEETQTPPEARGEEPRQSRLEGPLAGQAPPCTRRTVEWMRFRQRMPAGILPCAYRFCIVLPAAPVHQNALPALSTAAAPAPMEVVPASKAIAARIRTARRASTVAVCWRMPPFCTWAAPTTRASVTRTAPPKSRVLAAPLRLVRSRTTVWWEATVASTRTADQAATARPAKSAADATV